MAQFILAKETNAPVIAKLRQSIWAMTYRGIYPDEMIDDFDYEWHTTKDLERIHNPEFSVYLIADKTQNANHPQPIGYLITKKGNPFLLQSLYILPQYQRLGIGKQAFSFIKDYCHAHAISSFICHCQPDNQNAISFYHKMGGKVIAEENETERWQSSIIFSFDV